jgi:hypothetical protein
LIHKLKRGALQNGTADDAKDVFTLRVILSACRGGQYQEREEEGGG